MLAADLLDDLTNRDIRLRVDGDKVKARGHLTADDRDRIRQHKAELLAYLRPCSASLADPSSRLSVLRAGLRGHAGSSP